jgi:hypothetical protein
MTRDVRGENTDLVGEIRDQSQLFGLLDKVGLLGLELISVTPDVPNGTASPEPPIIRPTQEPTT